MHSIFDLFKLYMYAVLAVHLKVTSRLLLQSVYKCKVYVNSWVGTRGRERERERERGVRGGLQRAYC